MPGHWDAREDRPQSREFKVDLKGGPNRPPELGLSAYRSSLAEPDQVLSSDQRGDGWGLVRFLVGDLRAAPLALFVVGDPQEEPADIGRAHVEIRAVSRAGGKKITESQRTIMARLAGEPRCVLVRASLGESQTV